MSVTYVSEASYYIFPYTLQTEEEPYLRVVGPGSPGYTRGGGGPRSPGDAYARAGGPGSPEMGSGGFGPRSAIKRRSREEEEEQLRRKAPGPAKASIAMKVEGQQRRFRYCL